MDTIVQMLNLILATSAKIHCLCTILDQIPPLIIFIWGGEVILTANHIKGGGGYGRGGNGAIFFASLFHCWYYNPVTTFSLYLLAHDYHVAFQLVKKFSSLDVTVVFLM